MRITRDMGANIISSVDARYMMKLKQLQAELLMTGDEAKFQIQMAQLEVARSNLICNLFQKISDERIATTNQLYEVLDAASIDDPALTAHTKGTKCVDVNATFGEIVLCGKTYQISDMTEMLRGKMILETRCQIGHGGDGVAAARFIAPATNPYKVKVTADEIIISLK